MLSISTMRSNGFDGVSVRMIFGRHRQASQRFEVRLIDEHHIEQALLRLLLEQAIGSAVAIVRRDDRVARLQQLRQQRQRRHAR